MIPSAFLALPRRERAFIIASIEVRGEAEKERQKEAKRQSHKRR